METYRQQTKSPTGGRLGLKLSMQVESYADGSASISGSIGGCVIYPCRLSSEKAHMQLTVRTDTIRMWRNGSILENVVRL